MVSVMGLFLPVTNNLAAISNSVVVILLVHGILATRARWSGHILEVGLVDQAIGIPSLVGQSLPGGLEGGGLLLRISSSSIVRFWLSLISLFCKY
jgi:hypothetical protein